MSIENPFSKNDNTFFIREEKVETKAMKEVLYDAIKLIEDIGEQVNPCVFEYFEDCDLLQSLPKEITSNKQKLKELIFNMSKFADLHWSKEASGLFGEEVHIPETYHASGEIRSAQSGNRIDLDFLRDQGIDPSRVLFFRITQPTEQLKPEYYWTSDYFETKKGLSREISPEERKNAIILVASLDAINNNEGLIKDINDDSGLAVRQIGTDNFDYNLALTKIVPSE